MEEDHDREVDDDHKELDDFLLNDQEDFKEVEAENETNRDIGEMRTIDVD